VKTENLKSSAADLATYYAQEADRLGVRTSEDFVPPVATGELRRRRRRGVDDETGSLVLVRDEDGALRWEVGGVRHRSASQRRGRARRAGLWSWLTGREEQVAELHFERLPPNKVLEAIASFDRDFAAKDQGQPFFGLRRWNKTSAKLEPVAAPSATAMGKRILLIVHGTFSNCDHLLSEEILASAEGRALVGSTRYDEVLTFDHPTLSVSPMLNAFELARAMRGVEAEVCTIAHSRGGLVTRWWLEGFGGAEVGPRKAVLVGSPLAGTSLASPDRIRKSMDLLTNVGSALRLAGSAATSFAPFLAAPVVILKVLTSVTSTLARTPIADAAIALVPGLQGQSRVGNNAELDRLRAASLSKHPTYFAIRSNFEPEDAGWKFWRNFRKDKLLDAAADTVFAGPNDLVVDTVSMDDVFADAALPRPQIIQEWDPSRVVHHVNYFRQPETFMAIRKVF
jgi:hypothetical protein